MKNVYVQCSYNNSQNVGQSDHADGKYADESIWVFDDKKINVDESSRALKAAKEDTAFLNCSSRTWYLFAFETVLEFP